MTSPEGRKDDAGKLRMDLIPPEAIFAIADILTSGAGRYGDRNWEQGITFGRVFAAVMRHLWHWWARHGVDPDSGRSHLWHALVGVAFLVTFEAREMAQFDNRPGDDDA